MPGFGAGPTHSDTHAESRHVLADGCGPDGTQSTTHRHLMEYRVGQSECCRSMHLRELCIQDRPKKRGTNYITTDQPRQSPRLARRQIYQDDPQTEVGEMGKILLQTSLPIRSHVLTDDYDARLGLPVKQRALIWSHGNTKGDGVLRTN